MEANAADAYPPDLVVGATGDRVGALSPAARGVHRAILLGFATAGAAPDRMALDRQTAGRDATAALGELHELDVVRLDDNGDVRAAYPFSAVPTAHLVTIDDGPRVYAMCAIDALGIAAMLGRRITIASTDPVAGTDITV